MKRYGNIWPVLTSWENLACAVRRAADGKRSRPDVAKFLLEWELMAIELQRELQDETYTPGAYRTFVVRDPKYRTISAAPFRDRVVHHALTQVLEPIFERRFTVHSYACRKGLGTHRALRSASVACSSFPHVLQCDIRKYFHSIDHELLKTQLARTIKCGQTLQLAAKIIDGSNEQEPVYAYFPGDSLFTPWERRRGIPLGNQTSQFFANLYLNEFDQFVLRQLQPRAYCRYVDDFLIFHESKQFLREARGRVESALSMLRLLLHDGKSRVYRSQDGVSFLGWRIFPDHMRLLRKNVVRFRRRLRSMQREHLEGHLEWDEITQRVVSWNAHAAFGDTWRLRESIFEQHGFTSKTGMGPK